MHQARVEQTPEGLIPADDGWWVLNLEEIAWDHAEDGGRWCAFESPQAPSPTLGIGVHVLQPGEANGKYHLEDDEESFLVLAGECLLIVEGEERRMRQWDVFHCPPGTAHITVGAGDGPCAILMAGTRTAAGVTTYPPDAVAARYGADVPEETTDPRVAYAGRPPIERATSPWASVVAEASAPEGAHPEPSASGDANADPSPDDLRRQVAVLSAALGMREPLWDVPPIVRQHVRDGELVKAVRELRRGVPGRIGLLEAKRMVDALGERST
ncbi:cupin domain-containing protein [Patulibacter americanus]|uniref:cupin domain-containing protein n=1 Tax=Patulibacter americanus TaxID=588672 RepID=UPI0003B54AEC|nr:cupin domain-containing protein [Patulibacter americanus]